MQLEGRVALVTGASKGLGRAIALALAANGASVVVNGRDLRAMEETAVLVRAKGREVLLAPADIRDAEQIRRMVEESLAAFNRIDVLVNNAGGTLATPAPFEQLSETDWDLVMDTNLRAAFLCCKAVLPQMQRQRYGRIVHIASIAGRSTGGNLTGAHYVSAKTGLCGFSRQLAFEYGKYGITSNVVAAGWVLSTDRIRQFWESRPAETKQEFLASIPLGRLGLPEEVAQPVAFLASDEAGYITGATLDVNGGRFMG